jgi:hypothetical protein
LLIKLNQVVIGAGRQFFTVKGTIPMAAFVRAGVAFIPVNLVAPLIEYAHKNHVILSFSVDEALISEYETVIFPVVIRGDDRGYFALFRLGNPESNCGGAASIGTVDITDFVGELVFTAET